MEKLVKIGLVFIFFVILQSCEDTLGIEENYSKKLINGKEIEEKSYKEYSYMTIDTIKFSKDSIIYDTTKVVIPIYDSTQAFPTTGLIYLRQPQILSPDFYGYIEDNTITYANIKLNYPIKNSHNKALLNFKLDMTFGNTNRDEANKYLIYYPTNISLNIENLELKNNYWLYLAGELNSSNYGKIELIDKYGQKLKFTGLESNIKFRIVDVIYNPIDKNRLVGITVTVDFTYFEKSYGKNIWDFRMPMIIIFY